MGRRSESAIRIKVLRDSLSQSEFAKIVGVPQPKVSQCEAGDSPSISMFVLLGNYAWRQGRVGDAEWFWKNAGLDFEEMVSVAAAYFEKRNASAETVSVPLMRGVVGQHEKDAEAYVRFSRSVIPHPDVTTFLRVPIQGFVLPLLAPRNVIVIDSFQTDPWELEGSLIAAYAPPGRVDAKLQKEFAKVNTKEEVNYRRSKGMHPFERTGLFVGFLQPSRIGDSLDLSIIGIRAIETNGEVSHHVATWSGYFARRDRSNRGPSLGLRILGRVLSLIKASTSQLGEKS